MKRCALCAEDREEVSLLQVKPAGWTSFNNFVEICKECQETAEYKRLVKLKKIITPAPAKTSA